MNPNKPVGLVVDDELQMTQIVAFALETAGYESVQCRTAKEAWDVFQRRRFDFVILDRMLPDLDGATLCQRIRGVSDIPVLMLTALGDTEHRVSGLEAGADDYVPKPFAPRELILRVQAALRRTTARGTVSDVMAVGPLRFEVTSGRVFFQGVSVPLSDIEFRLLMYLAQRPNTPVGIRDLLNVVWETHATQGGRNMVKTTVYRLRKKLERAGMPGGGVANVRGQGYALAIDDGDAGITT